MNAVFPTPKSPVNPTINGKEIAYENFFAASLVCASDFKMYFIVFILVLFIDCIIVSQRIE